MKVVWCLIVFNCLPFFSFRSMFLFKSELSYTSILPLGNLNSETSESPVIISAEKSLEAFNTKSIVYWKQSAIVVFSIFLFFCLKLLLIWTIVSCVMISIVFANLNSMAEGVVIIVLWQCSHLIYCEIRWIDDSFHRKLLKCCRMP